MRRVVAPLSVAGLALFLIPAATTSDVSYYGCYSSSGSLRKTGSSEFMSAGYCRGKCTSTDGGYNVEAMTRSTDCLCGNDLPWNGFKVDDDKCNVPCGGYPANSCGSSSGDFVSVYLTGLDKNPAQDPAPSGASTTAVTASPSVSTSIVVATSTGSSNLDTTDSSSIKTAASTVAKDLVSLYQSNNTIPGILPNLANDDIYYWWEAGAMMNALVDYWKLTGDDSFVDTVKEALIFQSGNNSDYQPTNQSINLGNDDQSSWALAAMTAAENGFPAGTTPWVDYAKAVADEEAARWDTKTCNGGLRWQVFSNSAGYNYKNSMSNVLFLELNARLARFTGNKTYVDWVEKTQQWLEDSKLISDDWRVYDGMTVQGNGNCPVSDELQWSRNAGSLLSAYATMWNMTSDSTWRNRITPLLNSSLTYFANKQGIINEAACEYNDKSTCNQDQLTYKGLFSASLRQTMFLAPFTAANILPVLQKSAIAAYAGCNQSGNGLTHLCISGWANPAESNTTGFSQQISALGVVQSLLPMHSVGTVNTTVTNSTGAAAPSSSASHGAGSVLRIGLELLLGAPVVVLALTF